MDYDKKEKEFKINKIKNMMNFLDYRENETLIIGNYLLTDGKSYPSIDINGKFYSNYKLSKIEIRPSSNLLDYVLNLLTNSCEKKLEQIKSKIKSLDKLLIKFFNI